MASVDSVRAEDSHQGKKMTQDNTLMLAVYELVKCYRRVCKMHYGSHILRWDLNCWPDEYCMGSEERAAVAREKEFKEAFSILEGIGDAIDWGMYNADVAKDVLVTAGPVLAKFKCLELDQRYAECKSLTDIGSP